MRPINMKFHPDFYSKQKSRSVKYFHKSPGGLDILRMVSGHPYWERNAFVESLTQKSIILADWTLPHWDANKKRRVSEIIHQFLDHDFQIYAWHQNQLVSLYDPSCLDAIAKDITPVSDKILLDAAREQYQLLTQQIIIINYHDIPLLFGKERLEKHQMISTHLLNMRMRVEEIKQIYPDFSEIVFYDNEERETISKLCSIYFPGMPLTYIPESQLSVCATILSATYSIDQIRKRAIEIQNNTSMLRTPEGRIKIESNAKDVGQDITPCFKDINWTHLSDLTIEGNIRFDPSALSSTTSLRNLHLEEIKPTKFEDGGAFITLDLPQIKRLALTSLLAPVSSLILCEQLRLLNVDGLTLNQLENLFSGQFTLRKLQVIEINIYDTSRSLIPILQAIKARAPYLKQLALTVQCPLEDEQQDLDFYPLFDKSVSVKIILTNDLIESHVPQICQLFSNITLLGIDQSNELISSRDSDNESDTDSISTNKNIFPLSLHKVANIRLDSSLINSKELHEMLRNNDKLTHLCLSHCHLLDKELFEDLSLPHLEELEIHSCSRIQYTSVSKLISHSNTLKKIILSKLHDDEDYTTECWLPKLEYLELRSPNPAFLFYLTKNSERLVTMTLHNIDIEHLDIIEMILEKNKFLCDLTFSTSESLRSLELKSRLERISPMVSVTIFYQEHRKDKFLSKGNVDINTHYSPKTFKIPQLFYSKPGLETPQTSQYRLAVYNDVEFVGKSFCLKKTGDLQLIPVEDVPFALFPEQETIDSSLCAAYTGIQTIRNIGNDWTPIASLCSGEILLTWDVKHKQPIEIP